MEIRNLELVKRLYKAEIISDTGSKMDLVQTGCASVTSADSNPILNMNCNAYSGAIFMGISYEMPLNRTLTHMIF